jgi:hypothetical protein
MDAAPRTEDLRLYHTIADLNMLLGMVHNKDVPNASTKWGQLGKVSGPPDDCRSRTVCPRGGVDVRRRNDSCVLALPYAVARRLCIPPFCAERAIWSTSKIQSCGALL